MSYRHVVIIFAVALALLGLATWNVRANPIFTPPPMRAYCLQAQGMCASGVESLVVKSAANMELINHVNRYVNGYIKYTPETVDTWRDDVKLGDCDDYTLTKRRILLHSGFPTGALRIAIVMTETKELHAVLLVLTDKGALSLDNRFADPMPISKSKYKFLSVSTPNPLDWVPGKGGLK